MDNFVSWLGLPLLYKINLDLENDCELESRKQTVGSEAYVTKKQRIGKIVATNAYRMRKKND